MSTVKLVDERTDHPKVRAIFDDIKATKKIDRVPDIWRALATKPGQPAGNVTSGRLLALGAGPQLYAGVPALRPLNPQTHTATDGDEQTQAGEGMA